MDLILHHFDLSPFAEKVRLAFGLKGLCWQSVQIPLVMPKPDLTALTGGYRKTPVLQIGADIYCDTQRIAVELERRFASPPLFPSGTEGLCLALSQWSDVTFFRPGAALSMGTNHDLPNEILLDRQAFFTFIDFSQLEVSLPHFLAGFRAQLALVARMLRDGREFLFGASPAWADILAYFPVWMCRGNIQGSHAMLQSYPELLLWEQRVLALGHGQREEISAAQALAIAAAATPSESGCGVHTNPEGLLAGQAVQVTPDDYGAVPVTGTLQRLSDEEVAIRRLTDRVGEVIVHFPRSGYRVEKTQ